MARKATRSKARRSTSRAKPAPTGTPRERIIEAFMALLAEQPIERIGLAEIAERAGVSLAELRGEFGSPLAILAAHVKELDRKVLAEVDPDMAEESPRERLFDVLMRRLELLGAAQGGDALAAALGAARSAAGAGAQRDGGALAAMDADRRRHRRAGPKGMVRAQGLALLFANVLRTWVDDDDDQTRARSRRSTASWRAASASPACSTISAGFRRPPATCGSACAATAAAARSRRPRRDVSLQK